eukprot:474410-Pyramimonas_sp.AAC.1
MQRTRSCNATQCTTMNAAPHHALGPGGREDICANARGSASKTGSGLLALVPLLLSHGHLVPHRSVFICPELF